MMYEEFRHPKLITALTAYNDLVAAREAKVTTFLTGHSIPVDQATVDKYLAGYKRRLLRAARSRLSPGQYGLYAFAELPIAFLNVNVPAALPWSHTQEITGFEEDGTLIISTTQRVMRDYLLFYHESLDATKVLFPMAGKPEGKSRPGLVKAAELTIWKTLLENKGFNWANAGGITQWRQRLNSAAYAL